MMTRLRTSAVFMARYMQIFVVRGLESLGVNRDQYGSFFIHIIMSKLPSEVHLQIALVSIREVWEVEELIGKSAIISR